MLLTMRLEKSMASKGTRGILQLILRRPLWSRIRHGANIPGVFSNPWAYGVTPRKKYKGKKPVPVGGRKRLTRVR